MNLLFTICARAGSKGVKSKNSREFNGRPIVFYTLAVYELFIEQYGTQYEQITLAVNTDSEALIRQMNMTDTKYIYIERKEDLAGDFVSKMDVIRDTTCKVADMTATNYDIVVDLDLTSPIRTVQDIKGTIDAVITDENADIAYSVAESRRSPYFNMVCQKEDGYYNTVLKSTFVSRQQVPVCFDMNASIYAYRRKYLLSGKPNERKAVIWKMLDTAVLDIDSEDDYELLGMLLEHFARKYSDIEQMVCKANEMEK